MATDEPNSICQIYVSTNRFSKGIVPHGKLHVVAILRISFYQDLVRSGLFLFITKDIDVPLWVVCLPESVACFWWEEVGTGRRESIHS